MLASSSLVPLHFLNPSWHLEVQNSCLLKPGLENFEHYFASIWGEYNYAVVWTFFGIPFPWEWNENWTFQSCGHFWVFQISWHTEYSTFTASSFRIWNSSTGVPSPPLALFIVMLPKAHFTLHSRMSGSRWVTIPPSLSGSWRSFLHSSSVYSYYLFLVSSAHTISVLHCAHLCMKCSLDISNFLEEISSLSHSVVFL